LAAKLDVAGRLAEGRAAVDNTQTYVWACHLLSYQNPDLTLHPAQIRDWYSSEDGLDLHVLDADHSAVQALTAATDEALRRQRDQLTRLAAAWQGDGAESAQDFVRRHCDTAETLATALRTSADALAGLRDALWGIVDKKVATVGAIDNRRQADRPAWLGAAQTVITGVGDRAAASELLDQQVKPFVDNDIRVDWLAAVRAAIMSIGSSYDAATAALASVAPVQFDVPGELGPSAPSYPQAPADEPAAGDTAPTTRAPAASAPSTPMPTPSTPSAPMTSAPMTAMPPTQMPAAMPAGVGATPASAAPPSTAAPSGLEGFGQRFADALGSLVPSPSEVTLPDQPTPEPPGDPPSDLPAEENVDNPEDVEDDGGESGCSADEHDEDEPVPAAEVEGDPPPAEPAPPAASPEPEPLAQPPTPSAPAPAEAPAADAGTPCEIAADELPQAGQ